MFGVRLSPGRLWSMASAAALVFLLPLAGSAQSVYASPGEEQGSYSASAWQRLQDSSVQLESLAMRARQEARIDARHHGSEELAERIDDFARDAHTLRLQTHERNVPVSKINNQVRKLVDDARKVQKESAKADRHDPQTDRDWSRTVRVLDDIDAQYMAANGLAVATRGAYGPDDGYRARQWTDSGPTMVADLDRRADDAARLSESANLDVTPEIERLRDQVRAFGRDMDDLSPADTRADIAQMLIQARAAQADLSGSNARSQLRDDVNAMVGVLVQMREMTSEGADLGTPRPAGTSGYGPPPEVAGDRAASPDLPELTRELDARVARASDLAAQYDLDDVSNDVAHFQNKVRDFDDRAPSLSREDRQERIDSLLRDAQKTQRDLANRHASTDLVSEWNGIVDLLVEMKGRS